MTGDIGVVGGNRAVEQIRLRRRRRWNGLNQGVLRRQVRASDAPALWIDLTSRRIGWDAIKPIRQPCVTILLWPYAADESPAAAFSFDP